MFYLVVIGLLFLTDHSIKKRVERTKVEGQEEALWGGKVILQRLSNYGAAGSRMKDRPEWVKAASTGIMGVTLIQFFGLLIQKGQHGLKIAYSLIIGGGLSNLFDRYRNGCVTDYFRIPSGFKKLSRLVFNLSDVFILMGCGLMVIFGLRKKK